MVTISKHRWESAWIIFDNPNSDIKKYRIGQMKGDSMSVSINRLVVRESIIGFLPGSVSRYQKKNG